MLRPLVHKVAMVTLMSCLHTVLWVRSCNSTEVSAPRPLAEDAPPALQLTGSLSECRHDFTGLLLSSRRDPQDQRDTVLFHLQPQDLPALGVGSAYDSP